MSAPTPAISKEAMEAARERRAQDAADGWRDIASAQKEEGVRVLLGWDTPGYQPQIGFWSGDYHGCNAWCDDHYERPFVLQPTHWRPLPPAPEASA